MNARIKQLLKHKQRYTLGLLVVGVAITGLIVNTSSGPKIAAPTKLASLPSVLSSQTDGTDYSISIVKHRIDTANMSVGQRLIVRVNIENHGKQVLQIAPGMQMHVVTSDGERIYATAQFLDEGQVVGGPIAAGRSALFDVDFFLPLNSVAQSFVFQSDADAGQMRLNLL